MATLTVLSLGAGVQSTTLALMACEGTLPKPDAAIFADTGWEPKAVYEHLDRLEKVLTGAGIPLYRVGRGGNIRDDVLDRHVFATVPAQVRKPDGTVGKVLRQCTGKYKVEPVERKIRELLGARVREVACRFCEGTGTRVAPWDVAAGPGPCSVCRNTGTRRLVGSPPPGSSVEQWIGFSTDEIHRVSTKGFPPHAKPRFPLIEADMSRDDCKRWLAARGWSVAKSACVGCPYHGNQHWRDMRDTCLCGHPRSDHWRGFIGPEGGACAHVHDRGASDEVPAVTCDCQEFRNPEWADAVAFDAAFRTAPGLDGERYLHPSLLPLSVAPIDRVSAREWRERQMDIFDVLEEEGEPDGCSPYGCRSGHPVDADDGEAA